MAFHHITPYGRGGKGREARVEVCTYMRNLHVKNTTCGGVLHTYSPVLENAFRHLFATISCAGAAGSTATPPLIHNKWTSVITKLIIYKTILSS